VAHAISAGVPGPEAWVYVFHYTETTPREFRATVERNIVENDGSEFRASAATLDGAPAVRLDFRFRNEGYSELAYATEWAIDDGRGGTLVLAVGRRDPTNTIHDVLADDFTLLRTMTRAMAASAAAPSGAMEADRDKSVRWRLTVTPVVTRSLH
jgi:hypothetical protein